MVSEVQHQKCWIQRSFRVGTKRKTTTNTINTPKMRDVTNERNTQHWVNRDSASHVCVHACIHLCVCVRLDKFLEQQKRDENRRINSISACQSIWVRLTAQAQINIISLRSWCQSLHRIQSTKYESIIFNFFYGFWFAFAFNVFISLVNKTNTLFLYFFLVFCLFADAKKKSFFPFQSQFVYVSFSVCCE